jgi:hypothetical protein
VARRFRGRRHLVYYRTGAAVWRVPVGGGTPEAIVRRGGARPFAVDDERLYFTVDFHLLMESAKQGGPPRQIADLGGRVWRLGFDGDAVYAAPWMQTGGAVVRIDRRTGSATTLVRDAGNVHAGVAVDPSHIYWTANAEVRRCAKIGGEAEVVGSGPGPTADQIAVDEDAVYWSSGAVIVSRPTRGGATAEIGRGGAQPVRDLVAGKGYLYWLTDTELVRQSVTSRAPPVVNRRPEKRFSPAIAANASHVFWLSQRDREFSEAMTTPYRLMRLPR